MHAKITTAAAAAAAEAAARYENKVTFSTESLPSTDNRRMSH
jgi:hypothetical protein